MTRTIVFAGAKGGTGKTTTALNLAVALAERGRPTLLVDLDPQGSIGHSLCKEDTDWAGLAEHLAGNGSIDDALFATKLQGLTILPRGRLDPLDTREYELAMHAAETLPGILREVGDRFNWVILDAPSGLSLVTRAALSAADYVILPVQAEPLALRSVGQVLRVIEGVASERGGKPRLLGLLPTMVQLEKDPSFAVLRELWGGFSGVLETFIPRSDVFLAASEEGLPVSFRGGPYPPEAARFEMLAAEVEGLVTKIEGLHGDNHDRPRRELV